MGILNNIKDHFNKAEFTISPNKKLKTISSEFKKNFGLSLVFYKGNKIAESTLTMKGLSNKTSKEILTKSDKAIKIKASMKVGDAEKLFLENYGVKVQIKNKSGDKLIPNDMTIGNAARSNL